MKTNKTEMRINKQVLKKRSVYVRDVKTFYFFFLSLLWVSVCVCIPLNKLLLEKYSVRVSQCENNQFDEDKAISTHKTQIEWIGKQEINLNKRQQRAYTTDYHAWQR